tara:strand:- start:303 stop:470 length:168 start_codon:yes stop_codon:yes gene_type:complete
MANLQNSHLVDEDYEEYTDGEILDIIFDRFDITGDNATKQLIDKIDLLLKKNKNK